MEDFLTVSEIARRLKKATKTIYHYIEAQVIPARLIIRFGNSIRMKNSDFEKWIESQRGNKLGGSGK